MLRQWFIAGIVTTLTICQVGAAQAMPVTFDFDTGAPALSHGMGLPPDQTRDGMTAHFSSPSANAFSIQDSGSTFFTLSLFSGNYLYPNNQNRNALDILFSQFLTDISLRFATADNPDNTEVPGNLLLTAYANSIATPPVGSATAHGVFSTDTFPMGTLTFGSGTPFNLVRIVVPFQKSGTTEFLADNIVVTPADAGPAPIPEPGSLTLMGVGLLVSLVTRAGRTVPQLLDQGMQRRRPNLVRRDFPTLPLLGDTEDPAGGRGLVLRGGAQAEVVQDPADGELIGQESDGLHLLAAACADERIHLVHLGDQARPTGWAAATSGLGGWLGEDIRNVPAGTPCAIGVLAVEDRAVLSRIRDVAARAGEPLERIHRLEVTAERRVHAGAVEHGTSRA